LPLDMSTPESMSKPSAEPPVKVPMAVFAPVTLTLVMVTPEPVSVLTMSSALTPPVAMSFVVTAVAVPANIKSAARTIFRFPIAPPPPVLAGTIKVHRRGGWGQTALSLGGDLLIGRRLRIWFGLSEHETEVAQIRQALYAHRDCAITVVNVRHSLSRLMSTR